MPLPDRVNMRQTVGVLPGLVLVFWLVGAGAVLQRPLERRQLHCLTTGTRINLNTADAATLDLLPGIGPGLARTIRANRQAAGSFPSVDSLVRVKGVGPGILQQVRPYVDCTEPRETASRLLDLQTLQSPNPNDEITSNDQAPNKESGRLGMEHNFRP